MRQEILSAGFLSLVVLMLLERDERGWLLGLIAAWMERRSEVLLERERGRNLRQVMDQLPAGCELVVQRLGRLQTIWIVAAAKTGQGGPL